MGHLPHTYAGVSKGGFSCYVGWTQTALTKTRGGKEALERAGGSPDIASGILSAFLRNGA